MLYFGCCGDFLLVNLAWGAQFGIESNDVARETAKANGVAVFANASESLDVIAPEAINVVISDNALEHPLEPWRKLSVLQPLLKRGGCIHVVVPCEGTGRKYTADNINQRVSSSSPQSLGNLLKAAKWPPWVAYALSRMGRPVFNFCARVWGHIYWRWFQVEVIAARPVTCND
ncbi:MAG: hypothetical protein ACLPOA_06015 [Methylocella sp.]